MVTLGRIWIGGKYAYTEYVGTYFPPIQILPNVTIEA